jgi:glycosyltransferase involved in cell wall biosynthesis
MEPHVFARAERRARPDVFHPTTYRLLTRRPLSAAPRPRVVTVWDMIHERFAATMDPDGAMAACKREAVAAADAILCISECTRRDLVELLGVPDERIVVTHLAGGIDPAVAGPPVGGPPFFLHVGSRAAGYKNFDRLAAAFGRVAARSPGVRLRIVGSALDERETRLLAAAGASDRVVHEGVVGDARLAALYRDAVALVYPSLYEGFGIPPLEAAACGGVAAVSRAASLPEVMGDDAAWFDPTSVDDIEAALSRLLDDEAHRAALAARGPARAARFSWARTVARTVDLYRSLAG